MHTDSTVNAVIFLMVSFDRPFLSVAANTCFWDNFRVETFKKNIYLK